MVNLSEAEFSLECVAYVVDACPPLGIGPAFGMVEFVFIPRLGRLSIDEVLCLWQLLLDHLNAALVATAVVGSNLAALHLVRHGVLFTFACLGGRCRVREAWLGVGLRVPQYSEVRQVVRRRVFRLRVAPLVSVFGLTGRRGRRGIYAGACRQAQALIARQLADRVNDQAKLLPLQATGSQQSLCIALGLPAPIHAVERAFRSRVVLRLFRRHVGDVEAEQQQFDAQRALQNDRPAAIPGPGLVRLVQDAGLDQRHYRFHLREKGLLAHRLGEALKLSSLIGVHRQRPLLSCFSAEQCASMRTTARAKT
jgi:hypothetical protein